MIRFWNWVHWCRKCKAILSRNACLVSTRELTEEEKEYAKNLNVEIPSGYIVEWAGTIDSIPNGWHLYDMEKDEYNLRVRFLNPKPEYHSAYSMGGNVKYWQTYLIVKD